MGAKPKVKVIGGSWLGHSKSFSLREDNKDVEPTYFTWTDGNRHGDTIFFADGGIREDYPLAFVKKIAILVEPPSLHPENYEYIKENHDKFHSVLTYDLELLDAIPNGKFYPLGGSSIAFEDWGMYPKTKNICMIMSEKNSMPGHKIRHEIANDFGGMIDIFGAGVGKPFGRKLDILKDYRYCIVVESDPSPDYFSEKLIDAMSVWCYPIIWRPGKSNRFTDQMFLSYWFNNIPFLSAVLDSGLLFLPYELEENLRIAKTFRIAEDWIWTHYQELFT